MSAAAPEQAASRDHILGFAVMGIGMFMALLDVQVVASSLQQIGGGLSASIDETAWVQTSYLIGEIVMIPLAGWLSRVMSTRWLFTASAAGFTLSSVLCGLSWNIDSMIAFRVLQGFLGGPMIPTVFTVAFMLFRGRTRTVAAAVIGLIATIALTWTRACGWITDAWSWQWLFYINVAPGLLIVVLVPKLLHFDTPHWSAVREADYIGILLLATFLGCLQYVLEEGPRYNWLDDDFMRATATTSAVCGGLFVWRSLTASHPVLNLRLLIRPNFSFGCFASFVLGMGTFGAIFSVPLFLGTVRHLSSTQIGLFVCTTGVFQIIWVPIAAALSRRTDLRWLIGFGFACVAAGMWLLTQITNDWGWRELLLPQALRGFAIMFCIVPANTFALGGLTEHELRIGSGLYNLMRNLGGAIGIAVCGTVLNDSTNLHYLRSAKHLRSWTPGVARLSQGTMNMLTDGPVQAHLRAMKTLAQLVLREAQVQSFADAFAFLATCSLIIVVLVPFMRPCFIDKEPPPSDH